MATVTESGYGAFLPTYRNEMVDREALRGQMIKQAGYLTEMDKIYAQLEEGARQFDTALESKESQFARKLEFEYAGLEQSAEQFDRSIELDWYRGRSEAGYRSGQLALGREQIAAGERRDEMSYSLGQGQIAAGRDASRAVLSSFDGGSGGLSYSDILRSERAASYKEQAAKGFSQIAENRAYEYPKATAGGEIPFSFSSFAGGGGASGESSFGSNTNYEIDPNY